MDLDAFFASVEQLDNPQYRGKPVIVGGLPTDRRSVVSTASYEARAFGVHSAMPTAQAFKLCPQGIYLRPRMKRYHEKSEEVMAIFKNYSPDIQQISVDEAFIDITGTERLFGRPEDTAKKLKAEIFEKTGLTVSVGLAATKYCAKIASGLQKPDGLTIVPEGKESDFMLGLPITKVWGAGRKTLEKLDHYGIKTTKDIFSKSEKLLQSLMGNAAGSFLYNAVRGNAGADFHESPKSRSISAENTYEYDLIYRDAIDTALLSLCHTVVFRSLREKVRSSSVSLKIRYDDFTTVSVQSSSDRYVSSVDDLFERVKILFDKKYDGRSSIRLFGVALQNLEEENAPRQQELFDFGDEKKRKVEEAILKAQEKNPGLKITKARLLGSLSLLLMIFLPLGKARAEIAGESEKEADGAASIVFDTSKLPLSDSGNFISLFNRDFGNDKNVEFFAGGYWKSSITGGISSSFGFGSTPAFSGSGPIFTQNVDLSLYFMLNHHWYFEAAFADEFTKNTVAAGYVGEGYLKSARLSNRKITFPSIYSVDDISRGIGGGENQAPGLSFNWKGEKWQADTAIRYDLIEAKSKSWYGKNSISINEIPLSSYNTGNQYILPSSSLVENVKDIYVESSSGSIKDSQGRKYKKLDQSQYLLLASRNLILISKDAKAYRQNGLLPALAVTFYSSVSQSDFGDYSDSTTFLGKIQVYFSSRNSSIKVSKYAARLFTQIDSEDAVFLQHPSGFSPLAWAGRYDTGGSSASDAQLAFSSTGTASSDWDLVIDEDNLAFAQTDFFSSSHLYADLSRSEDESSDSLENLIRAAFPLGKEYPQVYLGSSRNEDLCLQVRTFSPVKRFEIGSKAVAGTVTVYKNGIIDSAATFDSESGCITLSSSPAATDHIKAVWYEESSDSSTGAFTAAAGFKYNFTENFSGDISASSRWSYTADKKFADSSYSSAGFASLATKASYKTENFSAANTMGATYENTNTTGLYRILGNDEKDNQTYYLQKKAGINLPADFAPVLNERTLTGTSSLELQSENKGSVDAQNGITDSGISGYAHALEWDFSSLSTASSENPAWSALTIYTPALAGSLANASSFSIAIKNPSANSLSSDKAALYLQLGVSSDSDFSVEEAEKIPTWKISDTSALDVKTFFSFDSEKADSWQIVSVYLSDQDRSIISSLQNFNARLILTSSDPDGISKNGSLYAGPYQCGEIVFNGKSDADVSLTNYQTSDSSLSSSRVKSFNSSSSSSKNYVQYFQWDFNNSPEEEEEISFTRYFSEIDLSDYKKLSFFLKARNAASVKISLFRPSSSGEDKALVYTIDSPSEDWKEYTVDLTSSSQSGLSKLDRDIVPTKLEISLYSKKSGSLSFDELYLSENIPYLLLQDKITASYRKEGAILKAGNFEILKDFNLSASGNASSSIKTDDGSSKGSALNSSGKLDFILTNIKVSSQANISDAYKNTKSTSSSQKNPLASASHSLASTSPFFNVISLSENYSYNPDESSLDKANQAKVDFFRLNIPLSLQADAKSSSDAWALNQNDSLKLSLKPGKLDFTAQAKISQKILTSSTSSGQEKFETENYAASWAKISAFSFDEGDEKAAKRNISSDLALSYAFEKAKLKPKLTFDCSGNYKYSSKATFTDSIQSGFEIPFTLNKNNFSFSWIKSSGSSDSLERGGSYNDDREILMERMGEKDWFFQALPFYDLLSSNLATRVYENEGESNFYTGSYAFNWKRPFFANKYDFFLPLSAKIEGSRDIRTGSSTSDFYQIKNTLNYNSMNIFGKMGSLSLFDFFSSDEYASSLSLTLKIPRESPSSVSYIFSGYIQTTLYFSQTNFLKSGFEGSIGGKDDWKGKCTFVWKRPAKSSLAKGIISIFKASLSEKLVRITKADSLNFSAASSSSSSSLTRKYSLAYSHATETQVTKYISLNTDVGASYYANWGKSASLGATATIGATIKF